MKQSFLQKQYRWKAIAVKHRTLGPPDKSALRLKKKRFLVFKMFDYLQKMTQGFKYGFFAGCALGVAFGIVPAIKHKQISILLFSMMVSGGMFSAIGGFGVLINQ